MATFEPAFQALMQWEDPGLTGKVTVDSGGKTKFGISQNAYPDLDIANLSVEDAATIYRNDYWLPLHCPEITNQDVANKLLNFGVNMGNGSAVKIFQMACCDAGHPAVADGKMGPITIGAINASDPTTLLDCVRSRAKDHYDRIIASDPEKYSQYKSEWRRRAEG